MFRICNGDSVLNSFPSVQLAKKYLRDLKDHSPLVWAGCYVEKKITDDLGDFVWVRAKTK